MKIKFLSLAIVALSITLFAKAQLAKTKKAVFIIVDGIPADVIEKLATPNLQAIAKQGGYSRAYAGGVEGTYSETPTISAVGYNSVLTGTWVNKHNVWDNDIAAPNYYYPTIFRYCKEQYPQKKTAIFSTWQDNRTKLVGDNFAPTGNIAIDYHYDGLELDTIKFPHDKKAAYLGHIDDSVALTASEYIKANAPDLSWVYLENTDDMGHMYGDGPQFYDAIKLADKRVGLIWQAIQYRQKHFNEDWLIIITTDHGRDAQTGKGHGGQSDRERRSWIFTNAGPLNEEFRQPLLSLVDIMPSIAKFMNITMPLKHANEVDGISFIDKISFTNPVADIDENKLIVKWKPVDQQGNIEIKIAITNNVKTGGEDEYISLGTVPLINGEAEFDLTNRPSDFYKILLQAKNNTGNYWIVNK